MSKIITIISIRNGLGRTTISTLLSMKLSELGHKILVIDNNDRYSDLHKHLVADFQYCLDDMKPYIASNSLDTKTFKNLVAKINENLDFIPSTNLESKDNTFDSDSIRVLAESGKDIYDYIIIDNSPRIDSFKNIGLLEVADIPIVVSNQNINNKYQYDLQAKNLKKEDKKKLKEILKKSLVIINQFHEDINYDIKNFKKNTPSKNIFFIYNSPNVANFSNGYKTTLDEKNAKEINKILELITGEEVKEKANEGITKKLKGLLKLQVGGSK